jgi:peptidase M28-like protein
VKRLPLALVALLAPALLAAQNPASVARAANSITPEDIRRRIAVIADDSMRGRNTPSPELEKTADYIAAEFRRLGLKPGGDNGTWFQRYPIIRRQVDTAASALRIEGPGGNATLKLGVDVGLGRGGATPLTPRQGPVVVIAGPADSVRPLAGVEVRGAWVALIANIQPQTRQDPVVAIALDSGAIGVVTVSNRADGPWQEVLSRTTTVRYVLGVPPTARDSTAPGLVEVRDASLGALGVDLAALRTATTRTAQRLAGVTVTLNVVQREISRESAPNVIGILEGSDPQLKDEYVFFTGHMDHVGVTNAQEPGRCRAIGADSICNGADDDASGTIAVVEAAEAFAGLRPRPRRSLVFMTVSGEERGLWGSRWYSEFPTLPLANIVADINTDMVGRNWKDTVVVIGKEHSDLGATLNRVSAAHPELNMRAIDDIWPTERFYFRSDHYNFARKGVPILFFFTGTHPDYHQVGDEVAKIDAEKESRIVKLVFYLGLDVANAAQRPVWKPESRQQIVQTQN